ncbi:MAG: hypothetical protein OXE58_01280, partial [Acidobacteria bacterium]|nr:hypothetical protein [Acidobacteriota bacterium]
MRITRDCGVAVLVVILLGWASPAPGDGSQRAREVEATGSLRDGERHGYWVIRLVDGRVEEGPYVDGERHGRWIFRWPDGQVEEGA